MLHDVASLGRLESSFADLFTILQAQQISEAIIAGKRILQEWSQKVDRSSDIDVLLSSNWERRWERSRDIDTCPFREPEGQTVFQLDPSHLGSIGTKRRLLIGVFTRLLEFAWDEDEDAASQLRSAIRAYFKVPGSVVSLSVRPRASRPTIVHHGNRQYSIGSHQPRTVTAREDTVLQAFLQQASMDRRTLVDRSGYQDPHVVLKDLTEKYEQIFAPAIRLAGKKSQGGYSVSICAPE